MPDARTGTLPCADPWRRFMSAAYEFVVLFGLVVFFGYGFSALTRFHGVPGPMRWGFQAFLFLVLGAYFVWFWSEGRRTLPMKTMSLLIVTPDGGAPSRAQALLRYLWAWATLLLPVAGAWWGRTGWPLLLLALPFGWTLFDRDRRALYDVLAGTRLVVTPPTPARPGRAPPTG